MIPFDLAFIHPSTVRTEFAVSLAETIRYHPDTRILPAIGKAVVYNKNYVTDYWLEKYNKDWLLWVDTDIVWTPLALQRLLETAAKEPVGIYSGLLYHYDESAKSVYPSIFTERDDNDLLRAPIRQHCDLPVSYPFRVEAVGGGFMLIHRSVFEAVRAEPHIEGYPFFFMEIKDGVKQGYTQYFFKRATDLGFTVTVEPRCEVKHLETVGLTSEIYDRWWL